MDTGASARRLAMRAATCADCGRGLVYEGAGRALNFIAGDSTFDSTLDELPAASFRRAAPRSYRLASSAVMRTPPPTGTLAAWPEIPSLPGVLAAGDSVGETRPLRPRAAATAATRLVAACAGVAGSRPPGDAAPPAPRAAFWYTSDMIVWRVRGGGVGGRRPCSATAAASADRRSLLISRCALKPSSSAVATAMRLLTLSADARVAADVALAAARVAMSAASRAMDAAICASASVSGDGSSRAAAAAADACAAAAAATSSACSACADAAREMRCAALSLEVLATAAATASVAPFAEPHIEDDIDSPGACVNPAALSAANLAACSAMISAAVLVLWIACGEVEMESSSSLVAKATLCRFFLADFPGVARMRFSTAWRGDCATAASVTRAISLAASPRDARSRRPAT